MDGRSFFSLIARHSDIEWLGSEQGATPADDAVIVRNSLGHRFAVSISAILNHTWEELEAVMLSRRSPHVMTHVTRIVGYYSQLQNWNASKLAELRDRHKGQYSVPEDNTDADADYRVA